MSSRIKTTIYKFVNRIGLKNRNFTIVSNNCWGGFIYQRYGLQYRTPFIGLFIFAPDYIKLLQNLEGYLKKDLEFIDFYTSKYIGEITKKDNYKEYPIAILGDIEIHFLHYKNNQDALEKWERRLERVNYNNMLVKFSDRDLCNDKLIESFDKLPFKNKLCITAKKYDLESVVQFDIFESKEYVENEWDYVDRYLNIKQIINNLK